MSIAFAGSPRPTIGVEWELALVDRRTRNLRNDAERLLATVRREQPSQAARLHGELLRNTVELVTGVCADVGEAMADLREGLTAVRAESERMDIDLISAGTHPFARWDVQQLTGGERYRELIERTQWWGRQMLIWGVHVHVGVSSQHKVFPILGALLLQYPHLLALSASSPVWSGHDTGYASNRAMMFQQLPTAGLPFHFDDWSGYEGFVRDQLATGVIDDITEVRWDIRPAPHLGTIEVRVCDGVPTFAELQAIVALIQCLVVDLDRRLEDGRTLPALPPWHVQENKWRAARYGLDAEVIVDADNAERPVTEDLDDILTRLEPVAQRLGCAAELAGVAEIPRRGASYQRQRRVQESSGGDLWAVVDSLTRELRP
ncbi:glutamate--cysteine ligase [Tomitella fengzijianii]|uniref:Putative glutamate--cysteine ligase 2 n=1 Tax=Tomitella fengzijianii TaxID=2597660 RepID=A0A516X5L0_9ACTN|nr:glutamate--cysteine ligase [Tomitella fengzijianii]QDQ98362.1 glutamate--cysteine ligase [Tomitella fengzijianii]